MVLYGMIFSNPEAVATWKYEKMYLGQRWQATLMGLFLKQALTKTSTGRS